MSKRVLVLGASTKPERYSNRAIRLLKRYNHQVIALGRRKGEVEGVEIIQELSDISDIHTVTIYLGPKNQTIYHQLVKDIKPKRVIFNPGTEEEGFERLLREQDVEVVEGCTLVMLHNEMF